jgi:hypothetical protein
MNCSYHSPHPRRRDIVGYAKEAGSGSQVIHLLARDNSSWRGERTASVRFCDKVPTLAHACRQGLVVHGLGFYPSPRGWSDVLELDVVGAIDGDTVLVDVHRESDVREDVHQWWESGDELRIACVDIADFETGDVFLR